MVLLHLLLQSLQLGVLLEEFHLKLVLVLEEVRFGGIGLGEGLNLGSKILLKVLLIIDHLLDVVVGVDGKRGTALNNLGQVGDFSPQVRDDRAGALLFLLSGLNELPSSVDLLLEE